MTGSLFFATAIGEEGSAERERADDLTRIVASIAHARQMEIVRADRISDPGRITSQIVRAINEAAVVVADLSDLNPNVMYEIGVADSFGKAVIVITNDPNQLPFDRRAERALVLTSMHFREVEMFGEKLADALDRSLSDSQVDNPVIAAAGSVALAERAPGDPLAEQVQSVAIAVNQLQSEMRQVLTQLRRVVGRYARPFDMGTVWSEVPQSTVDERTGQFPEPLPRFDDEPTEANAEPATSDTDTKSDSQ